MSERIAPEQFDMEWLHNIKVQSRSAGNPGTKTKCKYKDIICAFDIETTRIKEIEQSVMYIWQWQFDEQYTVKGRTWKQFTDFIERIAATLTGEEHLCVFVHNLSYEFQFLRGVYQFKPDEVFAIEPRKVLKINMYKHIEMRCSYIHSNMSLEEYTKKMKAKHPKTKDLDYDIPRYWWTPLTDLEEQYCDHDVLGLVESIKNEMALDGDDLYSFPLTSTGYVRRDVKETMRQISHTFVRNQLPDLHTYEMCREAFRGGNTHANRYYAGTVLHNVKSADRSSSYPDVLCNCQFPVTAFFHMGALTYAELLDLINVRKKAVLMRVTMTNIRLRDPYWGAPYLSRDKCRNIRGAIYDNGRILEAEYLETTITDIDFKIILGEYDFDDFVPFDVSHARYGDLPRPLKETIIEYYATKTALKNVEGQEVYYTKAKNKTNSIYGMMVQDPVKQTIDFIDNDFLERSEPVADLLAINNKKAFLCYQWGVWCTSWARHRLEEGIILAEDRFVYCDTDSVKYVGDIDWSIYNKERIHDSKHSGAYAKDSKGVIYYMGVYEQETPYYEFSTLGAKKYCYREEPTGDLHITIAGVTKKKGGKELEEFGGISAFAPGFVFHKAGGTEAVYNDIPEITHYTVEGREIEITANVVLRPSTYTLGITAEYERLLELSQRGIDI